MTADLLIAAIESEWTIDRNGSVFVGQVAADTYFEKWLVQNTFVFWTPLTIHCPLLIYKAFWVHKPIPQNKFQTNCVH